MIVVSGSGTPYAVIGATYPAGSTCTCTNGTRTVTLKDTSGTGLFKIPYAGTWTVTATNGTQTKSFAVSITAEGQVEKVTLSYTLYIVQAGVIQASGLSSYICTTGRLLKLTQNEGSITLKNNTSYSGIGYRMTDVAIDITPYKTLYCTGSQTYNSSYSSLGFGLSTAIGDDATDAAWVGGTLFDKTNKTATTKSYDVSAVTGAYYVGFCKPKGGMQAATVTDFWLK